MSGETFASRTKLLLSVRTAIVLVLVLFWAWAYEGIQAQLPLLLTGELRFYQILSYLDFRKPRVERVLIIDIDDSTFWNPPLSGVTPTNRKYLGDLITIAATGGAIVVAVDFRLNSMSADPGDDESRKKDNDYLLGVLRDTVKDGKPVVLTCWLVDNGNGQWKKRPLIFPESEFRGGIATGHINMPIDPRQIPLRMLAWEWDNSIQKNYDSFAMQIVNAYEDVKKIRPRTTENKIVEHATQVGDFVYGGFLKQSAFTKISAKELWEHRGSGKQCCVGQIVIIGGTWHEGGNQAGPPIESFPSPVGALPGLYMHANYVEALIDSRYRAALPGWLAVLVDLVLAGLMYYFSGYASGIGKILGILLVFLLLFSLIYFLFANLGLYLSFLMPLTLCFIHVPTEYALQRHFSKARKEDGS